MEMRLTFDPFHIIGILILCNYYSVLVFDCTNFIIIQCSDVSVPRDLLQARA